MTWKPQFSNMLAEVIGNHSMIKQTWGKHNRFFFFKKKKHLELKWKESNDKSLCPSTLSRKYSAEAYHQNERVIIHNLFYQWDNLQAL